MCATGFLNLATTIRALVASPTNITVICAGKEGAPCLEDTLCAGGLIDGIVRRSGRGAFDLDDGAMSARAMYLQMVGRIPYWVSQSSHARYLAGLGLVNDINYCSTRDLFDILPEWRDGGFVATNPAPSTDNWMRA